MKIKKTQTINTPFCTVWIDPGTGKLPGGLRGNTVKRGILIVPPDSPPGRIELFAKRCTEHFSLYEMTADGVQRERCAEIRSFDENYKNCYHLIGAEIEKRNSIPDALTPEDLQKAGEAGLQNACRCVERSPQYQNNMENLAVFYIRQSLTKAVINVSRDPRLAQVNYFSLGLPRMAFLWFAGQPFPPYKFIKNQIVKLDDMYGYVDAIIPWENAERVYNFVPLDEDEPEHAAAEERLCGLTVEDYYSQPHLLTRMEERRRLKEQEVCHVKQLKK